MDEELKRPFKELRGDFRALALVLLAAFAVGILTGLLGTSFYQLVSWCSTNFTAHAWLVWLLPAGGVVIVLMYSRSKNADDTNTVLRAVRGETDVSPWMVPLIYIGSAITRFFGGSVGTEGAAMQIGAGVAAGIGRLVRFEKDQVIVLLMSGISGGFAAIVGTPVTAIVLAIELAGVGVMYYAAILPCAVSAATSFAIASHFGVSFPVFELNHVPKVEALSIFQVAVLAVCCAMVSIILCLSLKYAGRGYAKLFPKAILRAVAGGLVIAILTWAVHTTNYNGDSLQLLEFAAKGSVSWESFLFKIAFTALTLGAGYKGGAIVPTLVTGATFGGFMGPVLGLPASLGAGIGMTAVFCGAINCPITSFVLGLEVFGTDAGLFFLLACAVSYVLSGNVGLYAAQDVWQQKLGRPSRDVPYTK